MIDVEAEKVNKRALVTAIDSDILRLFPIEDYLACFERHPPYAPYRFISGTVRTWNTSIVSVSGEDAREAYHKLALLTAIGRFDQASTTLTLTEEMRASCEAAMARMVGEIDATPDGYHSIDNDDFLRDLALCRQKLLPAGCGIVVYPDGVPRRVLFARGFHQFARAAGFFGAISSGFKHYASIHMDRRMLDQFTPRGWNACYLAAADLLAANPGIRGVFRGSWFLDPALEEISPKLTYLRAVPVEGGARLFYWGSDDDDIANALSRSETRRHLFKEGTYHPHNYLYVWPRRALLRWAARNR